MQKSTYSEAFAAFEEVARFDVCTCSDIPTIILGHGSAGNDATCDDPAISANGGTSMGRTVRGRASYQA